MSDTNKTLARIFLETADLLAQRQANPHRIRAYKRAAQTLASLPEDIAAIAGRGELQALPGIGRDLSGKIQEYLETGRIQSHEDLKTPLPSEVETWT
ncbi:MAG: histidinol-phosphatase, partial [Nitrospirales bacterium]